MTMQFRWPMNATMDFQVFPCFAARALGSEGRSLKENPPPPPLVVSALTTILKSFSFCERTMDSGLHC